VRVTRVAGTAVGAVGAALTAALASLCCVGPIVVSVVGVSGAVLAARLGPYRPYLMAASLLLLGASFWPAYASPTFSPSGAACPTRSGRATRLVLWIAAAAWIVALLLPSVVGA
jgi:mercuric ion transport protein